MEIWLNGGNTNSSTWGKVRSAKYFVYRDLNDFFGYKRMLEALRWSFQNKEKIEQYDLAWRNKVENTFGEHIFTDLDFKNAIM